MRYELADYEWAAIKTMLPNKPRGVPRVNGLLNVELEPSIGIATANGQLCVSVTFDVATQLEWFRRFEHLLRSISALPAP